MPRLEERLTQPELEPITLGQAKFQMNLEHDDDDPMIAEQIAIARAWVEEYTQTKLVRQKWRVFFDYSLHECELAPPPVQEIEQIQYIDGEGVTQTLSPAVYELDRNRQELLLAYGQAWPQTRHQRNAAWMDVWSGYYEPGNSPISLQADIPAALTGAVKMLTDHLYEHRGAEIPPNMKTNPALAALLTPYRRLSR